MSEVKRLLLHTTKKRITNGTYVNVSKIVNPLSKRRCISCDTSIIDNDIYIVELLKYITDDMSITSEPLSSLSLCKKCAEKIYNISLDDKKTCDLCGKETDELFTVEFSNTKIRYCKGCSHDVFSRQ